MEGVECTISLLLVLRLLEILDGSVILLQLEVDDANKEKDVRPLEYLPAIAQEEVLKGQVFMIP